MLTVDELINIEYIPTEENISLQLYIDFYEQYLCKYIFIFTLINGNMVKLTFNNITEIFHISGIEHIYDGIHMNGKRFVELVKTDQINLEQLKRINPYAYRDYIDRICSFSCIDTLIKNCEYLWYTDGIIPGSTIPVKYLLLKGIDGKNIHLGIDTYREKRPYFSRTLLVTEGNNSNKFIDKADERLRVSKIEIIKKNTNELIECIEREVAEQKSHEIVNQRISKWEKTQLLYCLEQYYRDMAGIEEVSNKILKILFRHEDMLFKEICIELLKKSELLEVLKEYDLTDQAGKKEWRNILIDMLNNYISADIIEDQFVKRFLQKYCLVEVCGFMQVSSKKFARDVANPEFKNMMDSIKNDIRNEISSYDRYWSGKISAETIRTIQKDYIKTGMDRTLQSLWDENKEKFLNIILQEFPKTVIKELKRDYIERICDILVDQFGTNQNDEQVN